MRYLTYDDYLNIGGTLEKTAFERVIDRACGIVDSYTQRRLQNVMIKSDGVKACLRDVCEQLSKDSENDGKISSSSQSAGGVSESVTYATTSIDDRNAMISGIIYDYLATETDDDGTPLMYKGCGTNHFEKIAKKIKITLKTYTIENTSGAMELQIPVVEYDE